MKTVGIIDAYDVSNRGDRAIVEAQIGWVRSRWPGARVVVFSSHHASNEGVFEDAVSAFSVIEAPLASSGLRKLLAPFLRWLEFRLRWKERPEYLLFRECEAFLMCGGGYLYSSPAPLVSRQLAIHCANALLALATGKPVLPFPQSWGPLRKRMDRWICRHLARRLAVVTTRGKKSSELVAELGFGDKVKEVPDVVLAIRELRPDLFPDRLQDARGKPSLGLSPINWSFDREIPEQDWARYLDGLVDIAAGWVGKTGGIVTLIPQVAVDDHDDDRSVCEELAGRFSEAGISFVYDRDLSWEEHWERVGRQNVFLGCRMHACIFALVSHVPTVGLAYQPKFHELYGQLGFPELAHEIDQFDPERVCSQLIRLFEDPDQAQEIAGKVDRLAGEVVAEMDGGWSLVHGESPSRTS